MMFSTTQEVEEEQLDSLPLTVNEKFPTGNGIDPPAIACEPAAKLIASAPKNIRRVFIGSPPVEIKNAQWRRVPRRRQRSFHYIARQYFPFEFHGFESGRK